jgi:hypothetical protein
MKNIKIAYLLLNTVSNKLVTMEDILKDVDDYEEFIEIPDKNFVCSNIFIIKNKDIINSLKQEFFAEILTSDLRFSTKANEKNPEIEYLLVNDNSLSLAYRKKIINLREMKKIQKTIETNFKNKVDYELLTYPLFKKPKDIRAISIRHNYSILSMRFTPFDELDVMLMGLKGKDYL